ncbi:MAG TPA: HNH endonuclease [Dehalococcoidia bacterium]|nr:HNH endonuclease [Dehalococcoidia bacterium]
MDIWGDDRVSKGTLSTRDKQKLYLNAKKRCENCGKKLDYIEMEIGHKNKVYSLGERTTLANSLCLCHACNKRQGTDSWATFQKKQGKQDSKTTMKKSLQALNITQLKTLAQKHKVTVEGSLVDDFFQTKRKAPTKSQYINKLASVVTEKELSAISNVKPKPVVKKKSG